MLFNKHAKSVLTTLLLLVVTVACADEVLILAKHEIGKDSGRYTAFPNLYFCGDNDQICFTATSRERRSHHDATGEQINLASSDCGLTWKKADNLPPAKMFADEKAGNYSMVSAVAWRALPENESLPDDVYVWRENGKRYVAQGVVEKKSSDNGKNWTSKPLSVPKHAVLMNYNAASHLRTKQGTKITALYYKENQASKNRVLIARKAINEREWGFITLPNSADWPSVGLDETALAELPDGRIIAFMRPDPDSVGYLYYSLSEDQGMSWSPASKTEIKGYPANLSIYKGKLLVTVGVRSIKPFAIDVYTLEPNNLFIEKRFTLDIAAGVSPSDFGYPLTLVCDSHLVTAYYVPESANSTYSRILAWTY